MVDKQEVLSICSALSAWWYKERYKKLEAVAHESMSLNPFMLPLIEIFHGIADTQSLAKLLVGAHLMIGHSTGFGKLVDEKLLPNVFKTTKLTASFRKGTIYSQSCFDDIDHIVTHADGTIDLLSLKASRWTIQLGQAVGLNHSFNKIKKLRDANELTFNRIVVGVFYGKESLLTDKYFLVRGQTRTTSAAVHDITDLSDTVFVKSGKDFWAWLNEGEVNTDKWILEGLIQGFTTQYQATPSTDLINAFSEKYSRILCNESSCHDPYEILERING
jgi:hypothetical protein